MTKENQYLKAGELVSADAILYFNEPFFIDKSINDEKQNEIYQNTVKLISVKTGEILFSINKRIKIKDKELWRKIVINKYRFFLNDEK